MGENYSLDIMNINCDTRSLFIITDARKVPYFLGDLVRNTLATYRGKTSRPGLCEERWVTSVPTERD